MTTRPRPWSHADEQRLRDDWRHSSKPLAQIAAGLGRSAGAVSNKAAKLGLPSLRVARRQRRRHLPLEPAAALPFGPCVRFEDDPSAVSREGLWQPKGTARFEQRGRVRELRGTAAQRERNGP